MIGFRKGVWGVIVAAAMAALAGGCAAPARVSAQDRYREGVVFVLPGIEGQSILNRDIAVGLDDGGYPGAIEVYDWTIGVPGIWNLMDIWLHERQSKIVADKISAQLKAHPGAPVHLIGHSGGGGIAVMALERLPAGQQIDALVLLAPAVSPDRDLTRVLQHTRFGAVNLYSSGDVSLLTVGTSLVGSMDRSWGPSAGATGFRVPAGLAPADKALYEQRLKQVKWDEKLARLGADGTHFGWASRQFAAKYLAPLLKQNSTKQVERPGLATDGRAAGETRAGQPAGQAGGMK